MRLSTNINEVIDRETAMFQQLIDSDKLLREVAISAVAYMSNRIQQEGKKSDGTKLRTKAKQKFGAYSKSWGKQRKENNRQIDYIDLTDSGDMMMDFLPIPIGENEYGIGFRGKNSEKADYLEEYFGDIFLPTEEEEEFIVESLTKKLDAIFK